MLTAYFPDCHSRMSACVSSCVNLTFAFSDPATDDKSQCVGDASAVMVARVREESLRDCLFLTVNPKMAAPLGDAMESVCTPLERVQK